MELKRTKKQMADPEVIISSVQANQRSRALDSEFKKRPAPDVSSVLVESVASVRKVA